MEAGGGVCWKFEALQHCEKGETSALWNLIKELVRSPNCNPTHTFWISDHRSEAYPCIVFPGEMFAVDNDWQVRKDIRAQQLLRG